jgi:ABC-type dipeptide/oligopeptide/nickel transport system permease component
MEIDIIAAEDGDITYGDFEGPAIDLVDAIQENDTEVYQRCRRCAYFFNDDNDATEVRIYKPVPVSTQYFRWLGNIVFDWNWGLSTRVAVNTPVFDVLKDRIPVTMKLNLLALFFYIPIGFTLGIIAALRKNTVTDNVISLGVMIFISVPSFVIMTMLVMIFGYQLEWLPTQFPSNDISGAIQITGLILPVLGLSFGAIAGLTRVTRAELTEVLTSEFLLLARTKGLTRTQAVIRHAMRNSMVPLVPGIIFSFVGLLSGSIIIERIYSVPGTGRVFLRAMTQSSYDYNVILGTTAFYTSISLFAVLLVDLSYGIVDPRIRMGARR